MSKRKWRVTRRQFLIGAGGVVGGVFALGVLGAPAARLRLADTLDGGSIPGSIDATPMSWFEISADNRVRLYMPKVEMGQGIHTSLGQIAAEELNIRWEQMEVVQADTAKGPLDSAGTGASNSVSSLYIPLREAAATMRVMLVDSAAKQLGVPASQLVAEEGQVYPEGRKSDALTYGEIVAATDSWEVPEEAPALKSRDAFRYIGKPLQRVDFESKLTGSAIYGLDKRVPNMLYGAAAHAPTIEGKMRRAAVGSAESVAGVVDVVIDGDFVGVVAESRAQAEMGVRSLDIEWDRGKEWQQSDIDAIVTVGEGNGTVVQKIGNVSANLNLGADGVAQVVAAEYRTPMAAHAHLEPQAALVDVREDRVEAWVATQMPALVRDEIAEVLGRDPETVNVMATYLGGGFGRKLNTEAATEAALLSQATGRPVHVGWNRNDEFRAGYLRPPTHHMLRGALRADGTLHAIEHQQASGDVAFPFLPGFLKVVMGADFGAWRGARIVYDAPHVRTTAWRTPLPVRTGWWRGLGLLANTFAVESFMDEMAHAANVDPLEFRLQHLPDDERGNRFRIVLNAAAERAGWGKSLPAGRAMGIATSVDVNTVVAHVAEVSIEDGKIRVHNVTAAMDPGMVINPDGAKAQTEGAIVMGLSSTLLESVTIKDGRIEQSNFNSYPLITMKETPDIDVVLLESGDEPFGVGEPPMGPIAAAVANGIFSLTGQRLRELPLTL
jgi:isoquinoline 1-oxidoreductase beta subunit